MNENSLPGGNIIPGRQHTSTVLVDAPTPVSTDSTTIESLAQGKKPLIDISQQTSGPIAPTVQPPAPADNPLMKANSKTNTGPIEGAERPSIEKLEETVTKINDFVQSIQRELHFSIDDESGETIVKVVEKATNEVVRQIPAEDLMESLKNINQNATSGIIISKQA